MLDMGSAGSESGVTLAEVATAIALASDLGLGQPVEHVLRSTVIASRLGETIHVSDAHRTATYWTTLFVTVGCTGQSYELAQLFGDDIELRRGTYRASPSDLGQLAYFLGQAGRGRSLVQRTLLRADLLRTRMRPVEESLVAHARVSAQLAGAAGLGDDVVEALEYTFTRWDGKGLPSGVAGSEIPMPMRLAALCDTLEVAHREGGLEAAKALAKATSGTWFDPELVAAWAARATELHADLDDVATWESVISAEPSACRALSLEELATALDLVGSYADLKSPWFTGHSAAVSDLAGRAAELAGLPAGEVLRLRQAALLHGLGRSGVPNSIWDKPGPLSSSEWERLRLYPYYTDRVLRRIPGLAHLAAIASSVHERMDGGGYPRGIAGDAIPLLGRYLAAAHRYRVLVADRPHRLRFTEAEAGRVLRRAALAGELDAAAVDAVLAASGQRGQRSPSAPAGLTPREIEVLALAARGLTTKHIAHQLGMAPKTAGNHIERIYTKIDASSRAEATLFAMRNGIV